MAQILGRTTINNVWIIQVDANPALGAGTPAPVGSLALLSGVAGENYKKVGALDTQWVSLFPTSIQLKTSVGSNTRTATTFADIPGMTFSAAELPAGTYLFEFSASMETQGVNGEAEFGLFIGGVIVPDTRREIRCSTALIGIITISTNSIGVPASVYSPQTVNGSQTAAIQYRSVNGQVIEVNERTFSAFRIA